MPNVRGELYKKSGQQARCIAHHIRPAAESWTRLPNTPACVPCGSIDSSKMRGRSFSPLPALPRLVQHRMLPSSSIVTPLPTSTAWLGIRLSSMLDFCLPGSAGSLSELLHLRARQDWATPLRNLLWPDCKCSDMRSQDEKPCA